MRITGASGNARVFQQIKNIPASIKRGIKKANLDIGKAITKEAKRTINEDKKSGRKVILRDLFTGRLRVHQESAPGQSPARFSGSLSASINYVPSGSELIIGAGTQGSDVDIIKNTTSDIKGQIGFGRIVDYARRLELKTGLNRPYLSPSIVIKQKDTENYYHKIVGRELLKE